MADGGPIAGRYELRTELGRGGFGAVWRSFDRRLSRDVAIKIVSLERLVDPDAAMARFRQEARAVAGLNHPNIVTAHDFGEHEGSAYLVMELITGGSLVDEMARARRPGPPGLGVERVRQIADQVCAGLDVAHRAGLVHRDLKPANIMTNASSGIVKIVDFGIVWMDRESRLTRDGDHLGTLRYAAPEQLDIGVVDGRADLYSLGCVLYELLAGRSPYRAETPADWLSAHRLAVPTPLTAIRPDVPDGLANLVHRLLAKSPADRPPTAAAVRVALATPDLPPIIGRAQFAPVAAAVGAGPPSTPTPSPVPTPTSAPASPPTPMPRPAGLPLTRPYTVGSGPVGLGTLPRRRRRRRAGSRPRFGVRPGVPPAPAASSASFGAKPRNGMATAGLVCGILPLPPFGFLFGLIGLIRSRRLRGAGQVRGILGIVFAILWVFPLANGIGTGLSHLAHQLDPGCIGAGIYTRQVGARIQADGNDVRAIGAELSTAAAELRADAARSTHAQTAADLRTAAADLTELRSDVLAGQPASAALTARLNHDLHAIQIDCS
jgi:serine/threonine protein kinase